MSLSKIRKCLKDVNDNIESLAWCEEEVVNLLTAVAEHVLALGKEHEICDDAVPPNSMTVKEFADKHGLISANRLYWLARNDSDFNRKCVIETHDAKFVRPDETLEYIKNRPYFKNTLARLDKFLRS